MGSGRHSGISLQKRNPGKSKTGLIIANRTVKDALGRKGTPKSMIDAATSINPNYSSPYTEGYKINCQRCVVAYEMSRRGYDVEALGNFGGVEGHESRSAISWYNKDKGFWGNWMGAFRHAKPIYVGKNLGDNDGSKIIANIEKQMKNWGPGSRAVIQTFWKGGGGHVFNVEVDRHGKVTWLEAQVGTRSPKRAVVNIENRADSMRPDSVMLVRTDNLRISNRIKEFVQPRKRLGKD